jgi:hypothetical protein
MYVVCYFDGHKLCESININCSMQIVQIINESYHFFLGFLVKDVKLVGLSGLPPVNLL